MTIRTTLSFCTLILGFVLGCQRDRPSASGDGSSELSTPVAGIWARESSPPDTILEFKRGGRFYSVRLEWREVEMFAPFQRFLDTIRLESLPLVVREEVDVTGDGVRDTCITRIMLSDSVPFIRHSIFSRQGLVWEDTLTIPDGAGGAMYWLENESLYVALRPFAGLYIARVHFAPIVGKEIKGDSPELRFLIHRDPDLARYLQAREGLPLRRIWRMDLTNPAEMVWDQRVGQFVLYYAP